MTQSLSVRLSDLFRTALGRNTGNVGYIGLSPDGADYHVVVPVDVQIARGVRACNRPLDGTPFGGYAHWRYLECPTYPTPQPDRQAELRARWFQAERNAETLADWAGRFGVRIIIESDRPI